MNLGLALRGSTYNSDFFPHYYDLVTAGLVYGVTYAVAAVGVASATATGSFALFNPAASGVQLVLLGITLPVITFPAAATGFGLGFQLIAGQQPSATTPGNTPQNRLVGSAGVAQAKTYTAGTLVGATTVPAYISQGAYLDLIASNLLTLKEDMDGSLIVQPNSGIAVVSTTATTATVAPSLFWAEIPLG